MARTYRLGPARRAANVLTKRLMRLRLAPRNYAMLTVRGRRTGKEYSTPVRPIEHAGHRWVVAPYGEVGWVRNVRASGEATLTARGREERIRLIETDAGTAGAILQKYVRAVPVTRPYFDVGPKAPVEQFTAEADRHPVFLVDESP